MGILRGTIVGEGRSYYSAEYEEYLFCRIIYNIHCAWQAECLERKRHFGACASWGSFGPKTNQNKMQISIEHFVVKSKAENFFLQMYRFMQVLTFEIIFRKKNHY